MPFIPFVSVDLTESITEFFTIAKSVFGFITDNWLIGACVIIPAVGGLVGLFIGLFKSFGR